MLYQGIQRASRILLESGMDMISFPLKCFHLTGNDPKALSDCFDDVVSILRGVGRSFVTGVLGRPISPILKNQVVKQFRF